MFVRKVVGSMWLGFLLVMKEVEILITVSEADYRD